MPRSREKKEKLISGTSGMGYINRKSRAARHPERPWCAGVARGSSPRRRATPKQRRSDALPRDTVPPAIAHPFGRAVCRRAEDGVAVVAADDPLVRGDMSPGQRPRASRCRRRRRGGGMRNSGSTRRQRVRRRFWRDRRAADRQRTMGKNLAVWSFLCADSSKKRTNTATTAPLFARVPDTHPDQWRTRSPPDTERAKEKGSRGESRIDPSK